VVLVGRPVADIVVRTDQVVLNGAFEDADIEIRLKDFREELKTSNRMAEF
jgi:hypothetical protein